ncbi:MAG TPA: non-homologous end-joining DNA ligase, partial [Solirubrobacterales bacterium]|nr:non-homologous end-joining DNA ligase [Solirubrobacterales bacterium]
MARAKTKTPAQLREYERKRDFGKTAEPAPRRRRAKKGAPRFVVQEHSARRLHWDLRLEHDGVAASWAIPNGIPDDPAENRKAIHTEDHPLEYLEFEGEIPAGEYGAGTMKIWDRGTYQLEKWEPGKVMLSFEGERLSGRYALFRAGQADKDWMIHRIDPPARERDPFPQQVPPMRGHAGRLPRRRDGWAAELLWRGERALAFCQPGRLRLQGADLTDVTGKAPKVRRLTRQLGSRDAVLDGELVALEGTELTYVIFDLLYLEGRDLCAEPYERRRELLDGLELEGEGWQTPAYSTGDAKALLEASRERGLAGLVLKRLDSPYEPGRRSKSWVEIANAPSRRDKSRSNSDQLDRGLPPLTDREPILVAGRELKLSNLDKVLWPETGFTKGEMIEWYAAIAPVLLPHLRGRPLTLKRYPDGVEGKHFYEKRCPKHKPDWVPTARVWSERHEEEIDYCLVEELPALVWTSNLADIELHTSLSLAAEIDVPTALVFDLDPGAPADVLDCAQVAVWIRGMFDQLGLDCYPKTSGSKGMQVYAPLDRETTYERTKPFAEAVARTLEAKFPDRVVSRMAKNLRPGKVLVDWSQNDEHKTTVCVYSLRARDRPT